MADSVEDGKEVGHRCEANCPLAKLCGSSDFGFEDEIIFVVKVKTLAELNLAAGAHERGPLALAELLGEKNFDAACGIRRA